jgi:hypothetical protein
MPHTIECLTTKNLSHCFATSFALEINDLHVPPPLRLEASTKGEARL